MLTKYRFIVFSFKRIRVARREKKINEAQGGICSVWGKTHIPIPVLNHSNSGEILLCPDINLLVTIFSQGQGPEGLMPM
jgi:hypothetical protein